MLRLNVLRLLQMREMEKNGTYLGLPTEWEKTKVQIAKHFLTRISSKAQSWKHKTLLYVGREVMLKAVFQAIPFYALSYFKFPIYFILEVHKIFNRFW